MFLPKVLRCLKQCLREQSDVELTKHAIIALIELATYESSDSDDVSLVGEVDARLGAFALLLPLLRKDAVRLNSVRLHAKVKEALSADCARRVEELVTMATDVSGSVEARVWALDSIITATAEEGVFELDDAELEALVPLLAEDALREKVVELLTNDDVVLSEGAINALIELATDDDAEDVARLEAIKTIIGGNASLGGDQCAELVPLLAEDALREKVVELLGNDDGTTSEQAINALIELAKDDHALDDPRTAAIQILEDANLGPNVLAATIRGLLDIDDINENFEVEYHVKEVLGTWMRRERARGHVATLKALVEFASSTERSPQSRTIAMQLLATFHNYYDVDQMPPLDDPALSKTLLEGAVGILAKDLFDDSDGEDSDAEEKPDDDTVKDARLSVCKLLGAIGDMKCLMPHVADIASLHPGPARIGAREIFRKLVAPDLPARIVQLLGHGCYTVRLLCLIQLESFTPGQLSREIWTAIEALQADSHDEVKALASLMVKNQLQPPGANQMYQQALAEFDAQCPPRLKRAKTAP